MEDDGKVLLKSFKTAAQAKVFIDHYAFGKMVQEKGTYKRHSNGIRTITYCCKLHIKCGYKMYWCQTEKGINLSEIGSHGSIPNVKCRGIHPHWRKIINTFARDKLTRDEIYNRILSDCDNDEQLKAIVPKKSQIKTYLCRFNAKLSEKKKGNLDEFYNFEGWCQEKPRFVETKAEFYSFANPSKSGKMIVIGSFHEEDPKSNQIRRTVVLTTYALFSNLKRAYEAYSVNVKNQMHLLTDGKHKVEVKGWMFIPFGTSTRYFNTEHKVIKQKFIPFVYTFGKSETKRLFYKTKKIVIDCARKFLGIDDLHFNIYISDHSTAIYGGLMADSMPASTMDEDEEDTEDAENAENDEVTVDSEDKDDDAEKDVNT